MPPFSRIYDALYTCFSKKFISIKCNKDKTAAMVLFAKSLTLMYGVQTRSVQSIINPSPVRFRSARRATVQLFGLSHVKPFKQRYTSCKLTAGEQVLFDNDVIQITGMADSVKQGQESLAFRSVGIYIVLSVQKMSLYSTKAKNCRP